MSTSPDAETAPPGHDQGGLDGKQDSPQELRNPRATRKGPDMPEDQGGHRTDPEEDYAKPDGSEHRGLGGP